MVSTVTVKSYRGEQENNNDNNKTTSLWQELCGYLHAIE